MSPADPLQFWKFEAKMLCPVNSLYNYYSRDHSNFINRWSSSDSLSRLKSGLSITGVSLASLLSHRPRTSLREHFFPLPPSVSAFYRGQEDIDEGFDSHSSHDKPFLNDLIVDNGYCFGSEGTTYETDVSTKFTESYQPVEEPWLLQPLVSSLDAEEVLNASPDFVHGNGTLKSQPLLKNVRYDDDSLIQSEKMHHQANVNALSEKKYPTEDPWLLYHILEPSDTDVECTGGIAYISEDVSNLQAFPEQQHQGSEQLISGRESNLNKGSVSTEILINCSVCTMQRIAVLEDGNLVELLLEPVKSNVQCDSVYLGVVTKLVPHMGGAFVNIGSSRPSLMDVRHNREPFIFPPFGCSTKDNNMNSASCIVEKHLDPCQVKQAFVEDDDDAELSDDDAEVDFEDDDFDEHENEDRIDVEEIEMANCTGCDLEDVGTHVGGFESQLKINGNNAKVQSGFRLSHQRGHKSIRKTRSNADMWALVRKGTKIVVQVVKEGLGTKGPTLTAYPKLRSRFWVLLTRCNTIGVSKKISGVERTRLRVIAKSLQPPGFGLTVRTVAVGHSVEELQKDLEGLLSTWRNIMEHAKSAALAADEGVEGAVPLILHQAMGQTLSVVQDYFNEKVKRMIVDSPRTYHEVTNYLQGIAPDLCDRVELHRTKIPLFDEFNIEEEINNILNKRVALPNGGSLVIEQTEALVSIDVNGGHGMFGQGASQEKATLDVNLAAAKQIARELRLRDIGGIIVVDFIDMMDDSNKRLVYEDFKKAVERDRSVVQVSELSKHGLMEITRKRVRPSVTFMISEPCTCCHGTGRVEALETSFSKIEHEICSLLATLEQKTDPEIPKSWPRLLLRVDTYMCDYLTSGKKTKLATLSSSLKVWILLKVARSFTRGAFEVKLLADVKCDNGNQQVVAMVSSEADSSKPTKRTKLFPVKKWKTGRKG